MDVTSPLSLLLLLLAAFSGDGRTAEAISAAQVAAVRSSLLSQYDRAQPPPGQVSVQISFDVLNVNLYEYSEVMDMEALVYLTWTDTRLKWVGSEVVTVDVYTDEIWTPDLGVMHKWQEDPEESSLPTSRCVLTLDGVVQCLPPGDFRSHCKVDQARWPYTQHNCTLRLASKLPTSKLAFHLSGVTFVYELASRKWDDLQITSWMAEVAGKSNIALSFLLKRRSLLQTATFVAPALVLALLSVSTWLLPSTCNERLLLATMSVFLHCLVIDSLTYAMPESGGAVPQVVLLYRDLLVVAGASFTAAVCLRGLSGLRALDTPVWLPTVLEAAPARLLLCAPHSSLRLQEEDDAEGLVSEEEAAAATPPEPAAVLALLMNRLGLVASAATCVAALSIRLPA